MTDTHETIADIIAAKRRLAAEMGKALGDQHASVEMLKDDADRIEAAHKLEVQSIERIVRDAIIDYTEQYPHAPNDDVERELIARANTANEWLKQHGFAEEPTNWSKEEMPCL